MSDFICAVCGTPFPQSYPMNATRKAKPKYCSLLCQKTGRRIQSERNVVPRFLKYVDARGTDDCWPWTGDIDARGYGRFAWRRGDTTLAHRLAYRLWIGETPESMEVCHACDNPRCVNPAHLWLGTHGDNVRDMHAKGRAPDISRRGEAVNTAKLTAEDVIAIRASQAPNRYLAQHYRVSAQQISNIRSGRQWKHVP